MRNVIAASVFLVAAAVCAFAEEPPPADPNPAPAAPATSPMVCKQLEAPTGSRLGARKVCKTQKEWDAQSQQEQKTVDDAMRRGLQRGGTPGQ